MLTILILLNVSKTGKHFIFPAVYEQKIVAHLLQHFVSLVSVFHCSVWVVVCPYHFNLQSPDD